MAVPRTRTSNARKNSRRSHHAKKPKNFGKCSNCGGSHLPHKLCMHCGHYSGRLVIHAKKDEE
ncbi:MAG: 50S ribosomal protein L32 [Chlamydiae bacterium]|nr:50S ribosomal protein L32 [Chlamydiota bacterium]NGX46911.1 50S ribosomal protein L32 [Chlamydiota bacterium]